MRTKKSMFFFCLIIFASRVFAQNSYSLTAGLSLEKSTEKMGFGGTVDFSADFAELPLFLTYTVSAQDSAYSFAATGLYFPTIAGCSDFGVISTIHTKYKTPTYFDLDLLLGVDFQKQCTEHFFLEAAVMYFFKGSYIFALKNYNPWVNTSFLALLLDFNIFVNPQFDLGFKISSYNRYKYNNFFTPFWTLYSNYELFPNIVVGLEIEAAYVDMFTLSANFQGITLSSFITWRLK